MPRIDHPLVRTSCRIGLLLAGGGLLWRALAKSGPRRRETGGRGASSSGKPSDGDAAPPQTSPAAHGLRDVPSLAATIAAMPKGLSRAKGPSLAASIDAAQAAVDACTAENIKISVLIADSVGEPIVLLSGDGAGVRSALITRTKVAIVVKYGISASEVLARAEAEPRLHAEAEADPDIGMLRGGAFPVIVGGERIAIVAVSGAGVAGTRELDDVCAMAAVARLLAR